MHAGAGGWLALPHTASGFVAADAAAGDGRPRARATAAFSQDGAAGRGHVPGARPARRHVAVLAADLASTCGRWPRRPPAALRAPRVGLYESWIPPMDSGWTRYVLERQLSCPIARCTTRDVRKGALRGRTT